jgi:hypothetical protein
MGIDRRSLTKAESGNKPVEHETAQAIANYYKVEIQSILIVEKFSGPANAVILSSFPDLLAKNIEIVEKARKFIVCFGSRSRDKDYLLKIEAACKANPKLVYKRILFYRPFHIELQRHLARLIEFRSPRDRREGYQTLHICVCDDVIKQPEVSICMSETQANFVIPSVNMPGNYDTSLYTDDRRAIDAWASLANELCRNCPQVETIDNLLALGVQPDGERYV